MKNILIVFAFMIIFKPVFPVLEYVVDYKYISEVLCINKDKPMMHCNGKCYLMKSLADTAKQETDQKKNNLLKRVDIPLLFVEETETLSVSPILASSNTEIYTSPSLYSYQDIADLLHPPIS